jgi:Flp pilus assembly protein TadD
MNDPFDEIMALVLQSKAEAAKKIGWEDVATREQVKAAKWQLSAAIGAAQQGNYQEALRLFEALRTMLPTSEAEIYVAQAICYARLGRKREMRQAWRKANKLEPDNEKLKEIAINLGLVN